VDKQRVSANYLIENLELIKHPEGGYFKEVYRSNENLSHLPKRFSGERSTATSIYFLLNEKDKSHLHKIRSDETWHFYSGSSVIIHMINENGEYSKVVVGPNISEAEVFQFTIPFNVWFAAELVDKSSFGLFGCTVAPGFDFQDFELAKAADLVSVCPSEEEMIQNFCLS
jgi:predicted cupin superfamily sugar epimerase